VALLTWNLLPDSLHDAELSIDILKRQLKSCFLQNVDNEMY